jgi:putative glutamine amidotransferase
MKTFTMSHPDFNVASWVEDALGWKPAKQDAGGPLPDFLILPGGADVNPILYGEKAHRFTSPAPLNRDYNEFESILRYRLQGVPMIGICRGMQMLHISTGGRLTQHINDHKARDHRVVLVSGANPLKDEDWYTNTYHHQQVPLDETAQYDLVMGVVDDRTHVEVIHSQRYNFLGMQFHPEYDSKLTGETSTLARDLILNYYGEK